MADKNVPFLKRSKQFFSYIKMYFSSENAFLKQTYFEMNKFPRSHFSLTKYLLENFLTTLVST